MVYISDKLKCNSIKSQLILNVYPSIVCHYNTVLGNFTMYRESLNIILFELGW